MPAMSGFASLMVLQAMLQEMLFCCGNKRIGQGEPVTLFEQREFCAENFRSRWGSARLSDPFDLSATYSTAILQLQ